MKRLKGIAEGTQQGVSMAGAGCGTVIEREVGLGGGGRQSWGPSRRVGEDVCELSEANVAT